MNWNMRTETWGLILSIIQILEVVVTSAKWIVWNFRQRENGKLLCTFRSEYQNLVFVKFFFTFDHSITFSFRFRFWKLSFSLIGSQSLLGFGNFLFLSYCEMDFFGFELMTIIIIIITTERKNLK